LDANFGTQMNHVNKVVNSGKQDIAFASELCNALSYGGGVKANSSKEIILDRESEQKVCPSSFPGLKKMHHRKYVYDANKKFKSLILFENSFSTGAGIEFTKAKLQLMMKNKIFQPEPETVILLGANNLACSVEVDAKKNREMRVEEKHLAAAKSKQQKANIHTKPNSETAVFVCPNKEKGCRRAYTSQKWLDRHVAKQKCALSKHPRRCSRAKNVVTKKNSFVDVAVKLVVNKGFSSVATVVSSARRVDEKCFVLSKRRKTYKLCNGRSWAARVSILTEGYARKTRWSSRKQYTAKQREFLKWSFSLGLKNINQKLTSEKAAAVMKVVGTAEGAKMFPHESYMACSADGKPRFARSELVEKYEIKSFFSRTRSVNTKRGAESQS
jgi:hypothetical protein